MAWFAVAAPLISGLMQSEGTEQDATANSAALRQQGRVATAQAYADEQTQRRESRQIIGRQAAALAQSGTGTGGTNANLIEQSTGNAELDALNIRYAGLLKKAGFEAQSREVTRQGKALAGAQLLQGVSGAYTTGMKLRGY